MEEDASGSVNGGRVGESVSVNGGFVGDGVHVCPFTLI